MTEFEAALESCLAALAEGRWDVDECLRRYPEHADALRPQLLTAAALRGAYRTEARPEFAASVRERFLIASGQRLQEALDVEPAPAFFAAARMRFLLSAQRMKLGTQGARRRLPLFHVPARALAGALATAVVFLSFSTYTVASASSALPGDWQYPVKLQTERVRLALAFGDDAKRQVKLDRAQERVHEIKQLGHQGKIIGPGTLDRLVEQTQPLVQDAADGGWAPDDAARLQQVAQEEKQVLQEVAPQVAPEAQPQLVQAVNVSTDGLEVSTGIINNDPNRRPQVIDPTVPLTATPVRTPTTFTATGTPAPGDLTTVTPDDATPSASDTPDAAATPSGIIIDPTPAESRNNVKLYAVTAGNLKLLIPGAENGWHVVSSPNDGVLLHLSNADGTSLIAINIRNGDMYWFIAYNGSGFDEVHMRLTGDDGTVAVVDRDTMRASYGDAANIPLYVLESIELPPEPTPVPSETSTPVPTATPAPPTSTPAH